MLLPLLINRGKNHQHHLVAKAGNDFISVKFTRNLSNDRYFTYICTRFVIQNYDESTINPCCEEFYIYIKTSLFLFTVTYSVIFFR